MSLVARIASCSICCLTAILSWSALAYGENASVANPPISTVSPLVITPSPVEAEQRQAETQARRSTPEAVAARAASVTAFAGLDTAQAAKLAGETFPAIGHQDGGPSASLPAQRITGYTAPSVANVELGDGHRGVIESSTPMAIKSGNGWSPIDLSLSAAGDAFTPANALIGVLIPKRASDGVQLPEQELSIAPVDPTSGSALGGAEGVVDGASVIYANTQTDTDTVVKPLSAGLEASSILRSAQSPERLAFKIGLPSGATLEQHDSDPVQAVKEGQVLATIPLPNAIDAEGTPVPVVTAVEGDTLIITVNHRGAGYRYPIAVDPTVVDQRVLIGLPQSDWAYSTDNPTAFREGEAFGNKRAEVRYGEGSYAPGQYGYLVYHTQGKSHIDAFAVAAQIADYNTEGGIAVGNYISIASPRKGNEGETRLSTWAFDEERVVCANGPCESRPISETTDENRAYFEVRALETRHEFFESEMVAASVYLTQEAAPSASFDTTDYTINGDPNAGTGQWVSTKNPTNSVLGINAEDQGVGVDAIGVKSPNKSGWGYAPREALEAECAGVQCNECDQSECPTLHKHGKSLVLPLSSTGELPDGEDTVEATVQDAFGLGATTIGKIRVDSTPPHGLTLSGLPAGNELGEGVYSVKAEAMDGTESTPSAGVSSLVLAADGRQVGEPSFGCAPGPCTAKGEWSINGSEFGIGEHKLTLTATDGAGNVAVETYTFKVHHAASLPLGPGSVNSQSGELGITANDVAITTPGPTLTVGRSYLSRHIGAGSEGPLGPQWSLSVGGQESIVKSWFSGLVTLNTANGGKVTFTSSGSGRFTSPTGDANLALTEGTNAKGEVTEYILRDTSDAATTRFTSTSGPGASVWKPTKQEGALPSQTVRYLYQTSEGVTEPTYALSPEPAGLGYSCIAKLEKAESLEKGCRALAFKYATATTATGENKSEWGSYKGRLEEVAFIAYNPATKTMARTPVAQYAYDARGRLRAEWDPRISPTLKTLYGYDSEGHLTALTPPGQETWVLTYGTLASDSTNGRVLKVAQAPASASLWNGEGVKSTEAPKLSGTPVIGVTLGVSSGAWSNGAVAYGYQWEDCNSEGTVCTPIAGATNPNYTVNEHDVGYRLVALVTATNGGGSAVAASAASGEARNTTVTQYNLPEETVPTQIAAGPDGNLWTLDVPEVGTPKIVKISTTGSVRGEYALPGGSSPTCIVTGPDHNLWFTEHGTTKVGRIATSGTINEFSLPTGSGPECITSGPDGNLWVTETGTNKIAKVSTAGAILAEYKLPEGSRPTGIATSPDGNVWFSDSGTSKIGKVSMTGTVTEYLLPEGIAPEQIIAGPNETMWFARGSGIEKITTGGAVTSVVAESIGQRISGLALGPDNNVWVIGRYHVLSTHYFLRRISSSGSSSEYLLGKEGAPSGITAGPEEDIWFTKPSHGLDKATTTPQTGENGEARAPEPGWTMEYGIPISGASAPNQLGATEVEAWGQKDDPVEGVAIFPPDEPQAWPATRYKRATISYLDSHGNVVNTETPGGGVATSEFNTYHDVVRTLRADNRATALKESCESKDKCKSAEVAKLLDSENTYNESGSEPGTELLSTLGPQHKVELPNHTQVEARTHTVYSYDEGEPSEGGPYHLVTKTTQGAVIGREEPAESVRTVTTSYAGQEGLGWKLRKATSTVTDPAGLDLVHKAIYDKETGNVTETRSPGGNSEAIYPFAFSSMFGSEGTGNGQFKTPAGSAADAAGNVWVVDEGNARVEKFSSSGSFVAAYGTKGSGNLQFKEPWGIAINQSTGNVYVADKGNSRIEELSSAGAFVATFGTSGAGALSEPTADTIDSAGNVWVSDWGHNRLVEFNAEGTFVREAGSAGSGSGQINGPGGLVVSEGSVFVADYYNGRIDQFSSSGAPLGQFGSSGSGNGQFKDPYAVTANPSTGALYVADTYNHRIQELTPAGRFLTSWETWGPAHQLSDPTGLTVGAGGKLYASDLSGNKVSSWTPPEAGAAHLSYASALGSSGSGNGQFSTPINTAIDGEGNLWVTDCGNNRIEKFSAKGSFIATYGKEGSGNGQYHCPGGIDVNQSTGNVYVADTYGARVEELSSSGSFIRSFGTEGSGKLTKPGSIKLDSAGDVWVPDMSADKIFEFSSSGTYIASYGKEGSGEVQFKQPTALAFSGENLYVADSANHRVQELSNKGVFIRQFGKEGAGGGELYDPEGIAADAAGNLYVVDAGASHVEEFTSSGGYLATFATKGSGEGQLKAPIGDAIDAAGDMYVVDAEDNRVEKWSHVNQAVHYSQTVYYSAGANSTYPGCGGHPEWANLLCLAQPTAQPETSGLPKLPVTEYDSYNQWDEPEQIVERVGTATTRTVTSTYDGAGRVKSNTTSATEGATLPSVNYSYAAETGAETGELTSQSTTTEGKTKKITNVYSTLGQLTSYTDADGNTSTYEYDVDGRVKKANDGKGTQTFTYSETLGLPVELVDSSAEGMKFTAAYDTEGNLVSEGYPNGMNANYTYNPAGTATGLEYKKTTHCLEEHEKCRWLTDVVVPSIHGQWLEQTSTLSHQAYTYDGDGRLTEVQNTPSGKGCTTRLYGYDEETDTTSETVREPGTEGKCATEGGTKETHTYDEADRLIDGGVSYGAFGDITSLPSSDAGGAALTSAYYSDNQLQSQTQNSETIGYNLDPAGRTRETVSTGKTTADVTSHYAGPGSAPAWTVNTAGEATRLIPGIDGQLAAIQKGLAAPVLQLTNLHGDIIATASTSETASELLSKTDTSEFGVPTISSPPPYSWLGGAELSSELSSGVVAMGARSYVPQIGRFLQPDPIPGGSADAYSYTFGDPVDTADPSGEYTATIDEFDERHVAEAAAASAAARAAEIRAAEEAAARAAAEAAAAAAAREAEIARILGEGAGAIVGDSPGGGDALGDQELHAAECWVRAGHVMRCEHRPAPEAPSHKTPCHERSPGVQANVVALCAGGAPEEKPDIPGVDPQGRGPQPDPGWVPVPWGDPEPGLA